MPSDVPLPEGGREIVRSDLDLKASIETAVLRAQGSLTGDLFHYTNAESAIFGILSSGSLRLSPFESTNDLWESRPQYPSLSSHYDDQDSIKTYDSTAEIWSEIDRNIRLHAKVACLTRDFTLPDNALDRHALRGWRHLSLWAHYGAGHAGICLRFNRDRLIQSFAEHTDLQALRFHGPVQYLSSQGPPATHGLDIGQIKEFGTDAVAMAYAEANPEVLFFSKHRDWENEAEYRLILLNQSVLPSYVNIRGALTGVLLGDAFPSSRLPALREALAQYPDVEVEKIHFMNRSLMCMPVAPTEAAQRNENERVGAVPRRGGSLQERLAELREAESTARELRAQAEVVSAEPVSTIAQSMSDLCSDLSAWPDTEVTTYSRITAVPERLRSRRPGVPGERVHLERGTMCVVENLPKYSHTLVAAAAVQVLDHQQMRLHAVISTERWDPDGNERREHWRSAQIATVTNAVTTVQALLTEMKQAVAAVRPEFDSRRRQAFTQDPKDAEPDAQEDAP